MLLQTIKQAAVEAVNASKPVNIVFGNVIADSPLKIILEQKITLDERFIILPQSMTRHAQKIIIDGEEKEIIVDNSLTIGDMVALIKIQGGQRFIVIGKLYAA